MGGLRHSGEMNMKIKRLDRRFGGAASRKATGISTESGALNAYPHGFSSRFEAQRGGNPEELIGAAH
jgi:lipoyl-dependent peroxiredoxin